MLSVNLIIVGISVCIDILLFYYAHMHYVKTRFVSSFLLSLFYFLFGISDIIYFVVFLLNENYYGLCKFLMDFTIYLGIFTMPILVIFFESLQSKIITINSLIIIFFASFMLGMIIDEPRDLIYVEGYGWNQIIDSKTLILSAIFLILIFGSIIYRFLQFKKNNKEKSQISHRIIIFGLIFGFMGELIIQIFNLIHLMQMFLIIGFAINAFIYIKNPSALFVSTAKIYQFLVLDKNSGLVLFKKGLDFSVFGEGLYASTLIQQEIAGTKSTPHELIYGDRIFLIEHKIVDGRDFYGILILNKNILGIRLSLKFALSKFLTMFKERLNLKDDDLEKYHGFDRITEEIFSYIPFVQFKEPK